MWNYYGRNIWDIYTTSVLYHFNSQHRLPWGILVWWGALGHIQISQQTLICPWWAWVTSMASLLPPFSSQAQWIIENFLVWEAFNQTRSAKTSKNKVSGQIWVCFLCTNQGLSTVSYHLGLCNYKSQLLSSAKIIKQVESILVHRKQTHQKKAKFYFLCPCYTAWAPQTMHLQKSSEVSKLYERNLLVHGEKERKARSHYLLWRDSSIALNSMSLY